VVAEFILGYGENSIPQPCFRASTLAGSSAGLTLLDVALGEVPLTRAGTDNRQRSRYPQRVFPCPLVGTPAPCAASQSDS
jgi:hypothetical protein